MIIELRGVEFVNKGAELMLHSIRQKVKEQFPNAIFAMELTHRVRPENLAALKIHVKKGRKAMFLPTFIRRRLKIVHDKEINIVLDGSGFAFGDQWGPNHANKKLGFKIADWREQGKKIILLPQAFGSFADQELKTIMEKIVANADLIFAREQQSYLHLTGISSNNNIHLAPDFTNLISGKIPEGFDATAMQVAIIPNCQMIKKKKTTDENYLNFLCVAIKKIISLGLKPYFLIHEGAPDVEIAKRVNTLLEQPLNIIINNDPLVIKGIISTAYFIVCSRFHGVVSALSQGVPSISTSWSHKYEMLHLEYDFEEGLIKNIESNEEIEQKITALADGEINKKVSEKLSANSLFQKERSAEMWNAVFDCMQLKN